MSKNAKNTYFSYLPTKIGDVFLFSDYFEVDAKVLFNLIYSQKIQSATGKKIAAKKKDSGG